MHTLLVALHGILTRQTDPSWPDRLDAWMSRRDAGVKVLKKEYAAGPLPRWNCLVRNPRLARALEEEIVLFLEGRPWPLPPTWFVAHSNGAVIALRVTHRLIARGYRVGGLILTGAACPADVRANGVWNWCQRGQLGAAIAYCSPDDRVLAGDARALRGPLRRVRAWLWARLIWPYGCLGRTGWTGLDAGAGAHPEAITGPTARRGAVLFTRWFRGGHSAYFAPDRIEQTFDQIYCDILSSRAAWAQAPVMPDGQPAPGQSLLAPRPFFELSVNRRVFALP
jgi:hypothetical protein